MRYETTERTNAIRVNDRYPRVIKVNNRPVSKMRKRDKGLIYEDSYIKADPFTKKITTSLHISNNFNKRPPFYGQHNYSYPILASSKLIWQRLNQGIVFKYNIRSYNLRHKRNSNIYGLSSDSRYNSRMSVTENSPLIMTLTYRKDNTEPSYQAPMLDDGPNRHYREIKLEVEQSQYNIRFINFPYIIDYPNGTHAERISIDLDSIYFYRTSSSLEYISYKIEHHYSHIGYDDERSYKFGDENKYTITYKMKLSNTPIEDNSVYTGNYITLLTENNLHRKGNQTDEYTLGNNYRTIYLDTKPYGESMYRSFNANRITTDKLNVYKYFESTLGFNTPKHMGDFITRSKNIGLGNNDYRLPIESTIAEDIADANARYGVIEMHIVANNTRTGNKEDELKYYFKMDISPEVAVWRKESYGSPQTSRTTSNPGGNIVERITEITTTNYLNRLFVNNERTNRTRNLPSEETNRVVTEWRSESSNNTRRENLPISGNVKEKYATINETTTLERKYVNNSRTGEIRNSNTIENSRSITEWHDVYSHTEDGPRSCEPSGSNGERCTYTEYTYYVEVEVVDGRRTGNKRNEHLTSSWYRTDMGW